MNWYYPYDHGSRMGVTWRSRMGVLACVYNPQRLNTLLIGTRDYYLLLGINLKKSDYNFTHAILKTK